MSRKKDTCFVLNDTGKDVTPFMKIRAGKRIVLLCAALLLAAGLPASGEEQPGSEVPEKEAEEQAVQEIQQLLEVSEVEGTEGMDLEALTEAFSDQAMSDYLDSQTGFGMQYPSVFVFDEEKGGLTAGTKDGKASLSIENMQGGNLTEEILLEAIKLEVPDAEPRKYEQNNCLRVDRKTQNGARCRTDLYLIAKQSFHHVIIEYPAEEQETYGTYIEYMINTMETKESEQG